MRKMNESEMAYRPECGIKSTAGARVLRGEKGTMAATQNEMERLRAERDALQQLNAALEREVAMADRCPEGWQCVPKSVTPAMADAYASDAYDTAQQCHDAVLAVAPQHGDAWLRKCVATRDAQIDELVSERDAALEREAALAAHVGRLLGCLVIDDDGADIKKAVSYTHLTLPTKRIV